MICLEAALSASEETSEIQAKRPGSDSLDSASESESEELEDDAGRVPSCPVRAQTTSTVEQEHAQESESESEESDSELESDEAMRHKH